MFNFHDLKSFYFITIIFIDLKRVREREKKPIDVREKHQIGDPAHGNQGSNPPPPSEQDDIPTGQGLKVFFFLKVY